MQLVVRRTHSSDIEPWLLVCDDVRVEQPLSVRNAVATDVSLLPDRDARRGDNALRAYLALLFTGNPHVFIPSMPAALVTVALVRAVELVFRSKRDSASTRRLFDAALVLVPRVVAHAQRDGTSNDLLNRLARAPLEELHIVEADGVTSVCRLLASLLTTAAREHLSFDTGEPRYRRLALGILTEAVMRAARAHIRVTKQSINTTVSCGRWC